MLCEGAGFGAAGDEVVATFRRLLEPWGDIPIGTPSAWRSDVSDDNAPIEFSVAIVDGEPEVRVLMEAQGTEPTLAAQRQAGLAFSERLEREFGASLTRLRAVSDLFLPANMQGTFALWHAVGFSPRQAPKFKAYLNPQAQGPARAYAVVEEALCRLGFPGVWPALTRTAARRGPQLDEAKYFALDLSDEPRARAKVYFLHHRATPEDLERSCSVADNYVPGEARQFALAMSGGGQLYSIRPPFTCPAFVSDSETCPAETTLYIPACAYARDDSVVRDRVVAYLEQNQVDPSLYLNILGSFANRPLNAGVGMQSWTAYRRHRGSLRLTVYLSTESNRVYAPGVAPAAAYDDQMFPTTEALMKRIERDSLVEHPFLQRLQKEASDTAAIWLLVANAYQGTSRHFVRWLAHVTASVEDEQIRCLLARQLYEELGEGDFSRAHSVLMTSFLDSLSIWRPSDLSDAHLAAGQRLGARLAKHYLAEQPFEGLGALMAGELCAEQFIRLVARLIRRQDRSFPAATMAWLHTHDELEGDHAQESLVLARLVPQTPEAMAAVERGALGLYQALWSFLDELYQMCFVERRSRPAMQEASAERENHRRRETDSVLSCA